MARKPGTPRQTGDHVVGYGRPPLHTRFVPGQSGNPRGRPKGSPDVGEIVAKALNEKVVVSEGGRRRKITKAEAAAKQLANKAASGDLRAIRLLHEIGKATAGKAPPSAPTIEVAPSPPPPQPLAVDFSKMTTKQLMTIHDAAAILQGREERPPPLMPPGDPEEAQS